MIAAVSETPIWKAAKICGLMMKRESYMQLVLAQPLAVFIGIHRENRNL